MTPVNTQQIPSAPVILAIDPDTDRSGLAILAMSDMSIMLDSLSFFDMCDMIRNMHSQGTVLRVCIEASHKLKANFHLTGDDSRRTAARKHYDVGRCHEVGMLFCDFCHKHGIPYEECLPLEKCWKGKDRKITHEELCRQFSTYGITLSTSCKKSNQEERDAALLAITRPEVIAAYNSHVLKSIIGR